MASRTSRKQATPRKPAARAPHTPTVPATTRDTALGEDILAWRVMPSSQRAYNVVEIASAWLATYSNPTNKIEVELRAVRDASGLLIPLHQVRADCNLLVPELAVRGQTLSGGPVPGVNQFWIADSTYRETASGDVRLTLQLDNYADRAVALLARLQIADEAGRRTRGVYRAVQSPGAQQVGYCGIRHPGATAGQRVGVGLSFVPILSNTPTGLSFTAIASTNVGSGPSVTAGTLTPCGCEVTVTATANGDVVWTGKYTTQGA